MYMLLQVLFYSDSDILHNDNNQDNSFRYVLIKEFNLLSFSCFWIFSTYQKHVY